MSQPGVWALLAKADRPMTKNELQKEFGTTRQQLDADLRGLRMRKVVNVTTGERGQYVYALNEKGKREA